MRISKACVVVLATFLSSSSIALIVSMVTLEVACEPFPTNEGGASSSSGGSSSGSDAASSGSTTTGPQPIDAPKLCARLITECGQALTESGCQKSFEILRVTPACITKINSATCADLTNATSDTLSTCFPPCTGAPAKCNPDGTLTFCSVSGTTQTASCQASCSAQGTTFSGTCGASFEGQVSERAQCWCK